MTPIIAAVHNLSKNYETYRKQQGILGTIKNFFFRKIFYIQAVKNISFSINEGELVGFLGPNGAGKTTTLKMLSGIISPTSGEVKVLGFNPAKREHSYQKQFSIIMGQKNQLIQDLPAIETFLLNKEIYEISDKEFKKNLDELVDIFGIKEILDIPVRKLSLGQRMKCELVAALIHKPKVLFLDEPTIGLDVVAQKNIRDLIKKYNQFYKTTIILTSHYMEDIKELCKRVIIINLGEKIYDGDFNELIKKHTPFKILRVTFSGKGVVKKDIEKFGNLTKFNRYDCSFQVPRDNIKNLSIKFLSSNLPIDDIFIDEVPIDDVIRNIFKKS